MHRLINRFPEKTFFAMSPCRGDRRRRLRRAVKAVLMQPLEERRMLSGQPPVAVDDAWETPEDLQLFVPAPGVLANDTDEENDTLSATVVDNPQHGELLLGADGSFYYTPASNFYGTDTFTYRASDGSSESNLATVTITVASVNDIPVAQNDEYTTAEDTQLVIDAPGILGNDSDVDGDPLTAVMVNGPSWGSLTLKSDGSFTYTPAENFFGTDSFTYYAWDGTDQSNVATVTITVTPVNDLPVANDDAYEVWQGQTLTIVAPGVLENDTDAESAPLSAFLGQTASHGTLEFNLDGSFVYTPAPGFSGTDTFTYRAYDGLEEGNTATVTITVLATNQAPTAVDDAYETLEDTPLSVDAPGVLVNDTDPENDPLTAAIASFPQHGTVSLASDGSFLYTPAANFHGTDSFTYRAQDALGPGNVATVTITVTPVNDAPVAADDSFVVAKDSTLTVAAPGVLGNDSDVDGDALTAVFVAGPQHGTLTLNADGSFEYMPEAGYYGLDSFTYQVSDGTDVSNVATVNIRVNAPPVAVDDAYITAYNTPLIISLPGGVLANDTDADGDALSAALAASTSNGALSFNANGTFTYIPQAGFSGTDTFTYRASDGTSQSNLATVTITVSPPVNQSPTAASFAVLRAPGARLNINLAARVSDPDEDALAFMLLTAPRYGQVTIDAETGMAQYVPAAGSLVRDAFVYQVSDGRGGTATGNVTIDVVGAGLMPRAGNPAIRDLVVIGTAGNDTIQFYQSLTVRNGVKVKFNGALKGTFVVTGRIIAKGLGGNDVIVARGLNFAAAFYGGAGNDKLVGPNRPSRLEGGPGKDTLLGGSGRDTIIQ